MFGGLTIGMAEFMPMGLLPSIATTLSEDIPTTGHLISSYALGVVIGAPVLAAVAQRLNLRMAFISLIGAISLANLLFSVAPNFQMLLAARFLSGLPHGAFFGLGAVAASRLAAPGKEAQAVATMFAGLTIANVLGVPIGTYVGHHLGWRAAFALVALSGLVATWCMWRWMPNVSFGVNPRFLDNLTVFRRSRLWLLMAVSAIGTGGLYAWISYIAPLATEISAIPAAQISLVMIVAGLGMAVGNECGGRIADRSSPLTATAALLLAMSAALLLLSATAHMSWMSWPMTMIIGGIAFAVIAPLQVLMLEQVPDSQIFASSLIQSTSNIGNALGAFLGGRAIALGWGYTSPEWVGAALAFTGFCFCLPLLRYRKTRKGSGTRPGRR